MEILSPSQRQFVPRDELLCRSLLDRAGLTLPESVQRLVRSGELEGSAGDSWSRCVATDRGLARIFLRGCNTPLVRGMGLFRAGSQDSEAETQTPSPVDDLRQASQTLPPDELARLVFVAFVRLRFLPDHQIDRYRRATLWRHNVAVGASAAMIARVCGLPCPGTAFFAGALHDIGLLANERLHGPAFASLVEDVDELSAIHEIERERLGWDHAQLGGHLLKHWGMPESAIAAARYHHAPDWAVRPELEHPTLAVRTELRGQPDTPGGRPSQGSSEPSITPIVACVALANHLCSRTGWSSMGVHNLPAPNGKVLQCIGIDASRLTAIWRQLPSILREASAFAELK